MSRYSEPRCSYGFRPVDFFSVDLLLRPREGYERLRSARLSVRLYACPLVYVKNDTRELYKNFLYVK